MTKSIAFFVDGQHEQRFIQNVCPGNVVRLINCNGKDVEMSAISKRIASLCRLLHGKCHPIIIVIDREQRKKPADDLICELLKNLKDEGVNDELIIGMPDTMIENWILADDEVINQHSFKILNPELTLEGTKGSYEITKYIRSYNKTTIGVSLLKKCRPSKMVKSKSFNDFISRINKDLCWWTNR
jgi:hypothetical protein